MDFLSQPCESCNNPMNGGVYKSPQVCPHCGYDHATGEESPATQAVSYTEQPEPQTENETESVVEELQPAEKTGEITAEQKEEAFDSSADITVPNPQQEEPEPKIEAAEAKPDYEVQEIEEPIAVQEEPIPAEVTPISAARENIEPVIEEPSEPVAQERLSDPISNTPPAYEVSELEPADVKLSNEYPTDKMVSADLGELTEQSEILFGITASMIQDGKFVGAKSPEVKNAMKKARAKALSQLRNSAAMSGANMVANIETNYGLKAVDAKTVKVTAKVEGLALAVEEEEDEYGLA